MKNLDLALTALHELRRSTGYKQARRRNPKKFAETPLGQTEKHLVQLVAKLQPPPKLKPAKVILPESFTPTHQTGGLAGYPAVDVFAQAGTPVGSPCTGVVRRHSGRAPTATTRPGGPYGLSIYIRSDKGADYFLTHFGSRSTCVGERVRRGEVIGTIADYTRATNGVTPSHIHEGKHE